MAVITVGGTMDAKGRVGVRRLRAAGRSPWRVRVVVLVVIVAAVAIPFNAAAASAPSVSASGPVVKVGMIFPLTGPIAANPEVKDALAASIAAFNKRGGAGTNHARLQADVCDSRGDANGEVACARQMVDDGVVATFNDLTYNNPAGVVDVLEAAAIPRIGVGGTDISEFTSKVSYPISAGVIAAYIGTAVGFKQDKDTKSCLVRTDAPTGATFKGFLTPMFTAVGVDIVCDVSVATGATDYAPYIAEVQRQNPDAMLISHSDSVTTQLIGAMAQLNAKIPMGGNPGSFKLDTLRKYPAITKGTVLSDSFPYPAQVNVKNFPGLKQYFADMKASGNANLSQAKLKTTDFGPWIATLAFVNVTKALDSFTPATVVQALQGAKNVDLLGLTPPWTPSTPGFSVFTSSSNHFVYISRFNGKDVVTAKQPIDVTQYIK
jgi:ABC-type branched-subunit amino acid transport system substrate-binding protein